MAAIVSGWALLLIGLALSMGGVWLIAVGGSWYFLLAGAGFLISGWQLVNRRRQGLWTYAALVIVTLLWALWEAGLDWWALVPRCSLIVAIGLWLATPWVARSLTAPPQDDAQLPAAGQDWRRSSMPLTMTLALALLVALISLFTAPHAIEGELPPGVAAATPNDSGTLPPGEWHAYGRTGLGQRYSPLDEITPDNVARLEEVWHYHTGDVRGPSDPGETTYEVTPLKVGDTLYLCTPHNIVIALNADTGEQRWRFDANSALNLNRQHQTCRGVSYYAPSAPPADAASPADTGASAANGSCEHRLFVPTADAQLLALDADSGQLCPGFGEHGRIDLTANMPNIKSGFYYSTSAPAVSQREGLVIVGGAINDNVSVNSTSGVVRAYDAVSGELVWNWDPGDPKATEPIAADAAYTANTPNMWSTASLDEALGMLYLPMGNESPDQWGANRPSTTERFSSSIVALDLASGKLQWVFQTVHHDLWDYDVPAQPSLVDLDVGGRRVPALVAPTKQGELYVLDRETGEPVLPVEARQVPQNSRLPDVASPTQPVSKLSFDPPALSGKAMWGATLFDQLACRIMFHGLNYQGRYTPPSTRGTLVYPGNFGVFNWGGIAVDPERQVAFTTPSYLAFVSTLVPREDATSLEVSDGSPGPGLNENFGAPFAVSLEPFLSPLGLPCQQPPWGYVAGADLKSGEIVWKHRNGTVRDLAPLPLPFKMGVPDLGGPVMTAGGVAFISGTLDYYVRGYDVTSGEELWKARLPAGGQATPMTYSDSRGKQTLLVVAGGHGSLGTRTGDSIIAYQLPD
ncbi:glucose/quinate/shikimate family membrane-bound PQQ-dependent dehydrogenase [Halomonas sp. HP20-15]|uniref:glucose/quinate/shikimate family membrane-bound PQQ-dependent dehydrogenase n=1 Tax=Halomonas sp. HP20-15 TaxID=3085901 RepID=UPI002980C716|nr:glucose/quinate/shikimate family membrane-bound PQQ-dependent dehydrogenase [Halomonas sp. HP20-15]MDW5378471.1 glucose/quinate/shikimate family membrane-bound PQQ-dependent dehydrogenase [Halomonas sp. HP20-15]